MARNILVNFQVNFFTFGDISNGALSIHVINFQIMLLHKGVFQRTSVIYIGIPESLDSGLWTLGPGHWTLDAGR